MLSSGVPQAGRAPFLGLPREAGGFFSHAPARGPPGLPGLLTWPRTGRPVLHVAGGASGAALSPSPPPGHWPRRPSLRHGAGAGRRSLLAFVSGGDGGRTGGGRQTPKRVIILAMPLEEASLSGKEKMDNTAAPGPMKADGTSSKGSHTWEYWKMARGSGKVTRKSCHLGSEGEKDSGFSDVSSEYLSTVEHTDSDDQPADSEHQPANSQKRAALQKASGGLTTEGAFPGLTPVYIVKNVLLKQPLGPSPTTQFLAWSSDQHPLSSAQGPPAQLFFLQPPVSSLKPLLPVQKPCPKETCLPLLSTYPKIAPHPGQEPQAKGAGVAVAGEVPVLAREGTTNKRFCLEETWTSLSELCPTPKSRDSREKEQGRDLPPLGLPSGQPASLLLDPETITQNAATASPCGPDPAVARLLSKASKKLNCGGGPGKQRRFHNTVEILRKSGLLDITLRTKELIRQNRNTQRDLSELQDHTQLFCEAVQNNDTQAWARLQQAMDRSATYWAAKGAGCFARLAGQPGLGVKPAGPAVEEEDATGDSLPCSPMNLPLTPITLVQVAMP